LTSEIALVLFILGVAIVLFASEKIQADLVALMVMLALILTGILTPREGFSGFSNPAVITVWAIYIVSAGLLYTGVADGIGRRIRHVAGGSELRLLFVILVAVAVMSAFMNNIGATAVLLPVTIGLGKEANIPPSKLLIPLAYASLLGGVTTLIGTPPNLLASDALAEVGLEPFSLFDYTPMGLIIATSGILYLTFIGRRLLPKIEQTTHPEEDLTEEYQVRDYLAELHVDEGSPLIGQTIAGSRLGEKYDLTVVGIVEDGRLHTGVLAEREILPDDVLLIRGEHDQIVRIHEEIGVSIQSDGIRERDLRSPDATVAELVISQKAHFIGKSLRDMDFRGRTGLTVLAIWREEAPVLGRLADEPLRLGDTLLVYGQRDRIEALRYDPAFLLLRKPVYYSRRHNKAVIIMLIFGFMIASVATGLLHISVAAVLAAVLAILTGCLTLDEAYKSVEWKSVFLIAGMLPMGIAMEITGTAQFLADGIINIVGGLGPRGVMVGLFILTTMLTAFMSNAAAAVLVAPIAIQTAFGLGVSPYAFVMGIAIAASNSFVTPIGHQACVLVYGPGGYRFFDYARVGLPLTILIWILMVIFLPIFWPM